MGNNESTLPGLRVTQALTKFILRSTPSFSVHVKLLYFIFALSELASPQTLKATDD